ncbi:MAG: 5'-methylthioadenosine/S-adenosylhomocysteine nucleosidase [Candidatus Zixiibacteriota bacterium]
MKPILIILVLSLLLLSSCDKFCRCTESGILILYAFNAEGELLAKEMDIRDSSVVLNRTVYTGQLKGKNIILAESGVGMTNAAMTTQKMIDLFEPKAVIFSGIAGAIDTSVHIGDITICEKWATHDYGYIGADGFQSNGIRIALVEPDSLIKLAYFDADDSLLNIARMIFLSPLPLDSIGGRLPKIIVGGHGVTGNQFIDQVEKRLWLSDNFDALVTDMETAAVAQVCAVNQLPFIAFRSASDLAGGSGSSSAETEIDQFFGVAASNSARVVMKFLEY